MNVTEPERQERGKTEVGGNEGIRYWSLLGNTSISKTSFGLSCFLGHPSLQSNTLSFSQEGKASIRVRGRGHPRTCMNSLRSHRESW